MTRPVIAVLDYGIGNLHSAQKALEHEGADAPPHRRPRADRRRRRRGAAGCRRVRCVHGLAACGRARRTGARCGGFGSPVPGHLRGDADVVHDVGGERGSGRARSDPRHRHAGFRPGPKIPQMQWNRLDIVDPDEPMLRHLGDEPYLYFVHSLHGVPDDAVDGGSDGRVRHHDQRGVPARQRVRRAVPSREVEPSGPAAARQLRRGVPGDAISYPAIDLLGGRVVRLRHGRLRRTRRSTATTRWRSPASSPLRARRGCTSSTSTRPDRATRSTGRSSPRSPPRSRASLRCRPAAGCGRSTMPASSPMPEWPGW